VSPGDADALACKAVALLQLQEYADADKVLQHKRLTGQMPLERVSQEASPRVGVGGGGGGGVDRVCWVS
jgi:hypothetical protein